MTKCLVVDDSGVMRKLMARLLKDMKIDAREAENGAQAIECCKAEMPELILLDWNMPVLDGLGFLKQLRAMTGISQPKVVFCTTETDFSRISEALSEGADEYIMKPFTGEMLESKLKIVGVIPPEFGMVN